MTPIQQAIALIVAHLKFEATSEDAFELRQSLSHHFQLFSGHTCP
jgi:hypothetical protein